MNVTCSSNLWVVFTEAAIKAHNSVQEKFSCNTNISLFLSRRIIDLIIQSLLRPEQGSFAVSPSLCSSLPSILLMSDKHHQHLHWCQPGFHRVVQMCSKPRVFVLEVMVSYCSERHLRKLLAHFCHLHMSHMQVFSCQIPDMSWIHLGSIIWPENWDFLWARWCLRSFANQQLPARSDTV